mgnify:FL=1
MRQVLYLFISGFLAFLSCTQDKIQMVSLGIDDVYYLPRMKTYLLSPATSIGGHFTGTGRTLSYLPNVLISSSQKIRAPIR